MKNILIVLAAIALTAGGCTSRTYVNRVPPRYNNRYSRHHVERYDHRYDRDYRPNGPYRY